MDAVCVDAMGGDRAPEAIVAGAAQAARELGIPIVLVGRSEIVERELARFASRSLPIRVVDAPETVAMGESPAEAIRRKPRSSIRVGLSLVRSGEAKAFVSAGNSGAVMAAAVLVLGNLPGIDRPAIAIEIPGRRGSVLLLDGGANVECEPENLVQFAVMGGVFRRLMAGDVEARVGLLANGTEPSKGTEATQLANEILAQMPIRYVGYVEGRDVLDGEVDVVVTDGFTGNVLLKTLEGVGGVVRARLEDLFRRNWRTRFAYRLLRRDLEGFGRPLDPERVGGAPLLGVAGVTILAHGASGPEAIRNAIRIAADAAARGIGTRIAAGLREVPDAKQIRRKLAPKRRIWKGIRKRFRGERGADETGTPESSIPGKDD